MHAFITCVALIVGIPLLAGVYAVGMELLFRIGE